MRAGARPGEIAAPLDPADTPGDAGLVFIGRARTPWRDREGCPRNLRQARERGGTAEIEIDAPWRPALKDLKRGDAVIVLTWLHEARRDLVVVAPRHREAPVGAFSVRAPVRPNPIGFHAVRLTAIDADAGLLTVDALDCLDGTPVLDIKPWIASIDVPPDFEGRKVRIAETLAWLTDGAPGASELRAAFEELCKRLVACGLPLGRGALFQRTLHPDLYGWAYFWKFGEPARVGPASHDLPASDSFTANPVHEVFKNPAPIRRRIEWPDCPDDFPVLAELRSAGMTDYLIQPLVSTDGAVSAVSWATARTGGFGDDDVADLDAICRPLARLVEVHSLRRTAENLLDTYVGHATGARILGGRIRRGDTEVIRAAILLADLRGFTGLVNERPGDEVIGVLNRFFDSLVPAIQRRGGEVLKFMGDGLLAIFASGDGATGPRASCQAALQAVEEAHQEIAVQNETLAGADHGRLRFGAGLHFGEVVYGNIGAAGRLDFTAIGASVNLAARLQRLARDLDRDFVASADFAARCGTGLVALGRHRLAGFPEPQEAFGAPDGAA